MKDVRNNKGKRNKYRNIVAICCGLAGATIGISFNRKNGLIMSVVFSISGLVGVFVSLVLKLFNLLYYNKTVN